MPHLLRKTAHTGRLLCGRAPAGIQCALSGDLQEGAGSAYNRMILSDHPVAFWQMSPQGDTETDLSGNGHNGTYHNGVSGAATMPNGDQAPVFNGSSQYLSMQSTPSLSIPISRNLTWEVWVQPKVLDFPNHSSDGYVDFMGKCETYNNPPTCEWEARLYDTYNPENRPNRLSAYVFNPDLGPYPAHLGSGADWQPTDNLLKAGQWLHVVAEYTTLSQPAACQNVAAYPGSIDIWVNGVKWDQSPTARQVV